MQLDKQRIRTARKPAWQAALHGHAVMLMEPLPVEREGYWTDPETGEQVKVLESHPVPIPPVMTPDRFMLIGQDDHLSPVNDQTAPALAALTGLCPLEWASRDGCVPAEIS